MKRHLALIIVLVGFVFNLAVLNSCRKMEGDQTVPAFLKIDKITIKSDDVLKGSSSSKITDAWVYVDNNIVGVYELPARVPVLKSGVHSVYIRPGIMYDGNSDTRGPNFTYSYYENDNVEFKEGEDTELVIELGYTQNSDLIFNENAENSGFGLQLETDTAFLSLPDVDLGADDFADPHIVPIEESGKPPLDGVSKGVIACKMDKDRKYVCIKPISNFDFFTKEAYMQDQPCYIEIESRSDIPVLLIMVAYNKDGTSVVNEYAGLNSKEDWTKVYFNITSFISRNYSRAGTVTFYLVAKNDSDQEKNVFIDNIKLIHS